MRRAALVTVGASIYLSLGLHLAGCGGAASEWERAQDSLDAGRHDEGIVVLEQLAEKYPRSEESDLVPEAIADAMIVRTEAALESGEWETCGRSVLELAEHLGDNATAIARIKDVAGTDAVYAAVYVENINRGPTDLSLSELSDLLSTHGSRMDGGLQREIAGWLCDHREEFPSYVACEAIDPDVSGIPIGEAVARLHSVEESCGRIGGLSDVCEGEAAVDVSALAESDSLEALRAGLDARKSEWIAYAKEEAAPLHAAAISTGANCWSASKRVREAEDDLARLERQELSGRAKAYEVKAAQRNLDEARAGLGKARGEFSLDEDDVSATWPNEVQATVRQQIIDAKSECRR